jgi:hypothetical protein
MQLITLSDTHPVGLFWMRDRPIVRNFCLDTLHIHFQFIKLKASTCLTIPCEQSTSITARYTQQKCVRVVPPDDEQVKPETCRGLEF